MKPKVAWVACLGTILAGGFIARASDGDSVEKQLRQELADKILSLRVPSASKTLPFDSTGQPLAMFSSAPWTTGGLLQVEQVNLKRNTLEIDCQRIVLALRTGGPSSTSQTLVPIVTTRSATVVLDLGGTPIDTNHVRAILAKVFEPVDVKQRIAAYWTPASQATKDIPQSEVGQVIGILEGGRLVYGSRGTLPPKVEHEPLPEYTSAARRKDFGGTAVLMVIVNEQGMPEILELLKDLGEGLDIAALAAVSEWRFKPATHDGKPVATRINVEVKFRPY
jgi:TonB family protein